MLVPASHIWAALHGVAFSLSVAHRFAADFLAHRQIPTSQGCLPPGTIGPQGRGLCSLNTRKLGLLLSGCVWSQSTSVGKEARPYGPLSFLTQTTRESVSPLWKNLKKATHHALGMVAVYYKCRGVGPIACLCHKSAAKFPTGALCRIA